MTIEEFNNAFDIRYDSIAGKSAPNIDLYEKSVYFTTAQLELIMNHYDPTSNIKQKGFEGSEKRRVELEELVKDFKSTSFFTNNNAISDNSLFVSLPEETMYIVNEKVKATVKNCSKSLEVIPMTHDEYNTQIRNPFKQPNDRKVWRMNISKQNNTKVVELIKRNDVQLLEYSNRYIKYPTPIIFVNLNEEFPNENLTIDGHYLKTECQLDKSWHNAILNRAVELALGDYKPQDLAVKAQLNSRDE